MKRLAAMALLVCALGAQTIAHASTSNGHIQVGSPLGSSFGGVSEIGAACAPGDQLDGIDGQWFVVVAGQALRVGLAGGATGLEDLDAYFYTSECDLIDDSSMATDAVSEVGVAPATAAFMVVDLYAGADASFTVTSS